jgi:signal transduction histidine kinase
MYLDQPAARPAPPPAVPAGAVARIGLPLEPVPPGARLEDVAEMFLDERYRHLLSLPVVRDGEPLGVISRYQTMRIFLKRYGRELHGGKAVERYMNPRPLLVDADASLEAAAQYITRNIQFPVTEDFIVTRSGGYLGVGMVLDVLKGMESQLTARATELGRALRQLRASQTQLVQSEKMVSLGQMVAGVAHEINTPLGYVRSNIEMLRELLGQYRDVYAAQSLLLDLMQDGSVDDETLHAQLDEVEAQRAALEAGGVEGETESLLGDCLHGLDSIGEIVSGLKTFSRLDQAMTAEASLNDCVEQTLVIARNVIKHRVTVDKRLGQIPPVRCAVSQINQVLLNLITNAAQAIEEGRQGVLRLDSYLDGDFVCVSVQDNGRGIPADVLPRIFDPFFTTKPVGQGTGLGLSISYQIVQEHSGRLRVTSTLGRGTRFELALPRQARQDTP